MHVYRSTENVCCEGLGADAALYAVLDHGARVALAADQHLDRPLVQLAVRGGEGHVDVTLGLHHEGEERLRAHADLRHEVILVDVRREQAHETL